MLLSKLSAASTKASCYQHESLLLSARKPLVISTKASCYQHESLLLSAQKPTTIHTPFLSHWCKCVVSCGMCTGGLQLRL